ncbi:hypothetical protein K439DRAFT_1292756, partial [Ramaria rubella]
YDILAIQEPYIIFGRTRAGHRWIPIYPLLHRDSPSDTRAVILVNSKFTTSTWSQLEIDSPNITAIHIRDQQAGTNIALFNIY